MVLMELGEYPFSQRYGWIQDRYGLSWQVMFMGERNIKQKIITTLMHVEHVCGRAKETIRNYEMVFTTTNLSDIISYSQATKTDKPVTLKTTDDTHTGT